MTTTLERARPATPPEPSRPPAEALGSRQRLLVLAAMCLALVLVIAGVSMLAVGLPSIGQGLGLGQRQRRRQLWQTSPTEALDPGSVPDRRPGPEAAVVQREALRQAALADQGRGEGILVIEATALLPGGSVMTRIARYTLRPSTRLLREVHPGARKVNSPDGCRLLDGPVGRP